jgi:TonB-linked SusC/RagA family outer membrane protein
MILRMKLTIFLILLVNFSVIAGTFGQTKVKLSIKELSLEQVLQKISDETDYYLLFSEEDIRNVKKSLSLDVNNASIEDVLDICLDNTDLNYVVNDETIIISVDDKAIKQDAISTIIEIKGNITDENGVPLPGATIVEGGTLKGSTSDADGNFTINVANTSAVLKVSYIGFTTQLIPVKDQTFITVVMEESASSLDEVVVTGMFKRKAATYTGAVKTITAKQLKMYGYKNLITTLSNIDPAFKIIENNENGSDPNKLPEINIRGVSSLPSVEQLESDVRAKLNTPLIILDGFEISLKRMRDLNNYDIKSVTLLKDASATAIYGSRGANGIVVITTKEPEQGKLRISYSSSINVELPDLTAYDLLNAREKLDLEAKAGLYDNLNSARGDIELKKIYNKILNTIETEGYNTNWMAKPLRTGIGQTHNLSFNGGSEKFRYSASINYNHIAGVMKGSNRENFNGSIDLSYNHKNLIFQNQLTIGINKSEETPYGSFGDYTGLNPYWHPYDENEKLIKAFTNFNPRFVPNPLYNASLDIINTQEYIDLRNNLSINWSVFEGFSMRASLGISTTINEDNDFKPASHTDFENYKNPLRKGNYRYAPGKDFGYTLNLNLSYSKTFAEKHQIFVGLNYDMSNESKRTYTFNAEGFVHDKLDFLPMALQYKQGSKPSGSESISRRVGVTTNINYSFDNRYFVDVTYRLDGSSQFGAKQRFSPFWSIGGGWNVHKEDFWNESKIINSLKLRATYGVTGSQKFSATQTTSIFEILTKDRYYTWLGSNLMGLSNPGLDWQKTNQLNFGFDAGLLNNSITIGANIYYKKTSNLISNMEVPLTHGFSSYAENIGKIENRGWEISVQTDLIKNEQTNFYWSVSASFSHNEDKILELSKSLKDRNEELSKKGGSNPNRIIRKGHSANAIYVVKSLGIDPSTGKELFESKNHEVTYKWDANDRVYAGSGQPLFDGNLSTMLNYGNFSMSLSFGFSWGGIIYNQTLIDRVENADLHYNVDRRVYEQRWKKPGDIKFFKGIKETDATQYSSRFIQNEAFLRCQNIYLSYRLNDDWVKKNMKIQSLNFSCNMGDLFYISTVKRERGLSYPFSHKISFSIQATF